MVRVIGFGLEGFGTGCFFCDLAAILHLHRESPWPNLAVFLWWSSTR